MRCCDRCTRPIPPHLANLAQVAGIIFDLCADCIAELHRFLVGGGAVPVKTKGTP